jgi:D-alanyl-D-alanine carboxypeptidase
MVFMKKKIFITLGFLLAVFIITNLLGRGPISFRSQANKSNTKIAAEKIKAEKKQIKEYRKEYSLDESTIEYNDFMIQAMSGIVIDAETGKILYEKEMHKKLPPASITKILTGIVALENLDLNKKLTVSKRASEMEAFNMSSREGEKLKTEDVLYALMMISANDAAEILAEGIDGNRQTFLDKMDEKIRLLELKETSFKNPSGLDEPGHTSSAYDIGKLTYYAVKSHPEILKYMGEKQEYSISPTDENDAHYWPGHVSLTMRSYPEMLGAKTGFTDEARNTFIGIAQKNGKKFIFVFMGSDRGNGDAYALLNFGLNKMQ